MLTLKEWLRHVEIRLALGCCLNVSGHLFVWVLS